MKVRGKVVAVTGGGNGIGRQLVMELLARGAKVAAIDIRQEGLDETVELAGGGEDLAIYVRDVTDREAIQALPDEIVSAHGAVDGIISNAGIIQPFVRLNDLDYDSIERVINVNLYGVIHVTKAFLPLLLERPIAHVANVSSMGGFLPVPGQTIYGASKAAVKLMTEGLYAELLGTNVGVSVIMPGATETEISANSGVDILAGQTEESSISMTPADEAAKTIVDGIESDRLHIYVGRDSLMMSLANRTAPKMATHLIYRQMKDLLPS